MNTILPTYVYTEMTPNPATMKFVADRLVIVNGDIAEFEDAAQAEGASELAKQLFGFPFVKGVFVMSNFITVTKMADVDWDLVKGELREFIQRYLMENDLAVVEGFRSEAATKPDENIVAEHNINSPLDEKIAGILDEYVRPAVEKDGGAIHFKGFKEGVVTVSFKYCHFKEWHRKSTHLYATRSQRSGSRC